MINVTFHLIQMMGGRVVPLLIQEAIYGTILFAAIWVIQKVLRIRSPYFQVALWLLLFVRLVLPPDWSLPFSGRSLIDHLFPHETTMSFHVVENLDHADRGIILSSSERLSTGSQVRSDANAILFSVWIVGAILFLTIYLKRLSRYHRIVRSARPIETGEAVQFLRIWQKRFKIHRSVRLLVGSVAVSPFTVRLFRPAILLPEKIFDPAFRDDIESVIAHELAHIKRWDDLWIRLQNFIQVIYFFHPLVWIAGSRLQLARECACDSLVLSERRIDRVRYGRGLLNILKMQPFGPDCVALIPSFTSERNKLLTRFKTMKGAQIMKKKHKAGLIVLLAGLALFVLPMAAVPLPEKQDEGDRVKTKTDQFFGDSVVVEMNDDPSKTTIHAQQMTLSYSATTQGFQLIMPVKGGRIASGFGKRIHPITKKTALHKGVDIPEKIGTPVLAAADGVVILAKAKNYDPNGYGKYLILQHKNALQTVYTQLDSILVRPGQAVKQGEEIGKMGESGLSTGPHLHFEVRLDGEAVDPEKYLEK